MPRKPLENQERKSKRLSLAVTAEEKSDVLLVAKARDQKDHSLILRSLSLRAIRKEARRLRSVLQAVAR